MLSYPQPNWCPQRCLNTDTDPALFVIGLCISVKSHLNIHKFHCEICCLFFDVLIVNIKFLPCVSNV